MELRDVLLVLHILGVVVMAFGSGVGLLIGVATARTRDLRTIAMAARLETLGGRFASLSAVFVLAIGVWLVIETNYEFSEAWLSASFLLWLVAMGLGGGVLARHARSLTTAADAAIARGETENAEVQAAFESPRVRMVGMIMLLMYPAFIYLMVVKPGA